MSLAPLVVASAPDALALAADELRGGRIVAVPTDTVYGLAVDPSVEGACAALFALKLRPRSVGLPVLVADRAQGATLAGALAAQGPAASLAARWWPGALTMVLTRRPGVAWDLGDAWHTIALRCPADPFVRALCSEVGPLAVTSANRHGAPTLGSAAAVAQVLGEEVALVVDGVSPGGGASTIVDCCGAEPSLLREGPVAFADVVAAWRASSGSLR